MYTYKSNIKQQGKYWAFRLPKPLLDATGWLPGDLLGFWGIDGKIIHLQRLCLSEDFEHFTKNSQYTKVFCKRIARMGGAGGVLGIKSFPQPLLDELKPKHNQEMYFLPAKDTFLYDMQGEQVKDVVFISFDKDALKRYDKAPEYDDGKFQFLSQRYKLPFFNNKLELTEKNTKKAQNKVVRANRQIHKDTLQYLQDTINSIQAQIAEVMQSKHPRKQEIVEDLQRSKQRLQLEFEELSKNPIKTFEEWKNGGGTKTKK
ncbi:MAG: hypothetical protein ABIC95_03430 [archaeon]